MGRLPMAAPAAHQHKPVRLRMHPLQIDLKNCPCELSTEGCLLDVLAEQLG